MWYSITVSPSVGRHSKNASVVKITSNRIPASVTVRESNSEFYCDELNLNLESWQWDYSIIQLLDMITTIVVVIVIATVVIVVELVVVIATVIP